MKKLILLIFVGALATNISKAQAPDPDTTARHFIIMASIGNLQEVSSGKLAEKKATMADVKSFGDMMVTDHSKAQDELMQLANSRGYQIPPEATATPVPDLELSKAKGSDFDRMYIHAMLNGHRSTVSMFQTYAVTGEDPRVKAFAQKMLPTLKAHLSAIKAIDDKYKNLAAK